MLAIEDLILSARALTKLDDILVENVYVVVSIIYLLILTVNPSSLTIP